METLLVLLVLTNLTLLGSSRLLACIRTIAVQGVAVGVFTLTASRDILSFQTLALLGGNVVLKGLVFPWLLRRAVRETRMHREVEPLVGYVLSLLTGILALGASLWLGSRLPLPVDVPSRLVVPVAFFGILTGLFLIVARKRPLTQVIGYLAMENGIYVFGVALVLEVPLLVELGVLLDVFVAVFVMGITMLHLGRSFEDLDTDELSMLKD